MDSIFLINHGLTCFDIYDRLIKLIRIKKKEDIEISKKNLIYLRKIRKNNSNKLSLNGIIETRELRNNPEFNNFVKSDMNANHFRYMPQHRYYCLCDRVSIETALILLNKESKNNSGYLELIVLPCIKYENSIKKEIDLTNFINSFGKNTNYNLKNYWNIDSDIISLKKAVKINWGLVDNENFNQLKSNNLSKIRKLLFDDKKFYDQTIYQFLICNIEVIKDIFKSIIKNRKFMPNSKMKIFNTQCFRLDFTRSSNELAFNNLSTIYPSKLGTNNIKYTFEGQKYDLYYSYYSKRLVVDKLNIIPKSRCFDSEKLIKMINILKKGKIENKSINKKKDTNLNDIQEFENIFKKINKN